MKFAIYLALIGAASADEKRLLKHINKDQPCRTNTTPKELRPSHVVKPLEHLEALPTDYTWGSVNGTNYLTNIKNQHLPVYCGSCWAQATSSALSDRIKIARKAAWPDINIAPQVLISCETEDDGCHGGEPIRANAWMHFNEVTDETCSTYTARGHDNGHKCSPLTLCKHCWPHDPCYIPDEYPIYGVDEFAWFYGEQNMMQEIYQRGPISCGIAVTQEMEDYTGGIFNDHTGDTEIVHEISIVGFGEEGGVNFWIIRNSWGIEWGEYGFMRLVRGTNNMGIESDCTWATVTDTWTDKVMHKTTQAEKDDPSNDGTNGPYPEASATDKDFLNEDSTLDHF
jgi:cathepsin X